MTTYRGENQPYLPTADSPAYRGETQAETNSAIAATGLVGMLQQLLGIDVMPVKYSRPPARTSRKATKARTDASVRGKRAQARRLPAKTSATSD